jgi:XTP/dITP diphosphohydrolase
MARRFTGDRLVIATHNSGKLREIAALMKPYGVSVVGASDLALPEPDETGASFEANAELKALAAAATSGVPALADDSGIVVAGLDGAPGIYSARWAGPERDFARAMALVEERLAGSGDRRASFVAVLSLAWPDRHVESFRGEVRGSLVWPPRGVEGFGYDPMFVAQGERATFGEMDPAKKYAMSHRADAFRKLAAACFTRA